MGKYKKDQADIFASENLLLIAEHLATKEDFRALEAKLDAKLDVLDGKITALDMKVSSQIAALDEKFSNQIAALDTKLSALDSKVGNQISALDSKFSSQGVALDRKTDAVKAEIIAKTGRMMATMLGAMAAIAATATAIIKIF